MRQELVEVLKRACPQIWRGLEKTDTNLVFGIQVGDGWFGGLCNLSVTLQIELQNYPEDSFQFIEVKEKQGGLVIRFEGSQNDSIYEMIDTYCEEAAQVCELCGTDQHVQLRDLGDSVCKTLCINCMEPFEKQ